MWLTALLPIISSILSKVIPDPTVAAEAQFKLLSLLQSGELAQITGQLDINKVEAANTNLFVSGWRPFIGWVCGIAFAYKFVVAPFLLFLFAAFGHTLVLPFLDFTEMSSVLIGMLGLGGLRTYEKAKGVA
jgi:hypothetical protein